jgi:hypothetical protein
MQASANRRLHGLDLLRKERPFYPSAAGRLLRFASMARLCGCRLRPSAVAPQPHTQPALIIAKGAFFSAETRSAPPFLPLARSLLIPSITNAAFIFTESHVNRA